MIAIVPARGGSKGLPGKNIKDLLGKPMIAYTIEEALKSFELAQKLRKKGFKTEVYPESSKLKKQLNYADKRNVKNVIIIGQEEFLKSEFTLKNMQTGQQETHNFTEIENIF